MDKIENTELPSDIVSYIKKWVKEHSDEINRKIVKETKKQK